MMPSETMPVARPAGRTMESVLENRWARLLVPSLSDLFFVAILAWLFMSAGGNGWSGLLSDGDAGWHIRTGEYILDNHTVPYQDLYSFSKAGAPWYAWEWLADVVDGVLHRTAGLKGVVLLAALMLGAFSTTLIRRMTAKGTHLFIALIVALMGIGSSSIHFLARPHVFTLLLMSVAVWMIEVDRERPSRRIWLLVPMTAVWTNLHGGFLALVATLGVTAIGTAIEVYVGNGRTIRDAVRYFKLTVACALASLVNPYGWNLHLHVGEYLQSNWIRSAIQEFQSPSFRGELMLQFEILMLVGLVTAGLLLRRRHVVEALWILFWAHNSLNSVRHVTLFVTVCAPIIAREISELWTAWTAGAKKTSLVGIINGMAADSMAGFQRTSLLPFAVALALMFPGTPIQWPKDFPSQLFPMQIVSKNAHLIARSRLFTTDQWGDYLIYLNPQQKVFIDGRSDFYGEAVGKEYVRLLNGHWQWREYMAKYNFDLVLVPVTSAIAELLKHEPGWKVVSDNRREILLVRDRALVPVAGNTPVQPSF